MNRTELLSSSTATAAALLFASDGEVPKWIQLTPVSKGAFTAQDGRKFHIDDPQAVIAASLERQGIPIDRDHATDLAAKSGGPAPAVGWITKIALHGPANEDGLWGEVTWTPAGKQMVADREYRFISPVLFHAKADTKVIAIGRAALTNDPALFMRGLFSNQETPLELAALCALLGLPSTATADDVRNAITALKQGNAATCALEKRIAEAAGLDVTKFEKLDETVTVALCAKLKAPSVAGDASADVVKLRGEVDNLQLQIATLSRNSATTTATAEVEAAIAAGKVTPAQKGWALDYCTREPEGFRKFVGAAPVILQNGRIAPEGVAADALSETEAAVCAQLGLKPEDFKATKALAVKGAA